MRPTTQHDLTRATSLRGNLKNVESQKVLPPPIEIQRMYDRQIESKTLWNEKNMTEDEKKSMFNCSSVKYNFINRTVHRHADSAQQLRENPRTANRKKVIAEIYDLSRLFGPKYHPDYRSLIQKDPNCFHTIKGNFSRFLDDAHKTGYLNKPFVKFKSRKLLSS